MSSAPSQDRIYPTDRERARRLWHLLEPIHAVAYFAPEPLAAYSEAGTRGFWMGYVAGRAAPLGTVTAAPVTPDDGLDVTWAGGWLVRLTLAVPVVGATPVSSEPSATRE